MKLRQALAAVVLWRSHFVQPSTWAQQLLLLPLRQLLPLLQRVEGRTGWRRVALWAKKAARLAAVTRRPPPSRWAKEPCPGFPDCALRRHRAQQAAELRNWLVLLLCPDALSLPEAPWRDPPHRAPRWLRHCALHSGPAGRLKRQRRPAGRGLHPDRWWKGLLLSAPSWTWRHLQHQQHQTHSDRKRTASHSTLRCICRMWLCCHWLQRVRGRLETGWAAGRPAADWVRQRRQQQHHQRRPSTVTERNRASLPRRGHPRRARDETR
jgi:hypothetical protein